MHVYFVYIILGRVYRIVCASVYKLCVYILVLKIVNWIDYDTKLSFKCFHALVGGNIF